jgi:serpin B
LVNAVYFKGSWLNEFKKTDTRAAPFIGLGHDVAVFRQSQHVVQQVIAVDEAKAAEAPQPTQVKMMHLNRKDFRYTENDQFQLLELPYGNKDQQGGGDAPRVVAYIVLPQISSASFQNQLDGVATVGDAITHWLNGFAPNVLSEAVAGLQKREGVLNLPRFGLECSYSLKDPLRALGMNQAFDQYPFTEVSSSLELLYLIVLVVVFVWLS